MNTVNILKRHVSNVACSQFVPNCRPADGLEISRLQSLVTAAKCLMVITGAGISTESGIPDYRSSGTGLYARTSRRPVLYQDFIKYAAARQRYWARNFVGWPQFSAIQPNATHRILADWNRRKKLDHLVTQNVDELHRKAGSSHCIELHGSSHRVVCLSCGDVKPRTELQRRFVEANPGWQVESLQDQLAPDGDVLLPDDLVRNFNVPSCLQCGGILKPDVVLFGDNVARDLVDYIYNLVDDCDTLLVLGSSLSVYSSYRFVHRAHSHGKNIAIVTIGPTRADNLARVKIDARCSDVLAQIRR